MLQSKLGFPGGSDGKESACDAGDADLIPGLGGFPWRREWQPTPVEFHGQRSLAGYSPWGCQELDMTEWLTLSQCKLDGLVRKSLSKVETDKKESSKPSQEEYSQQGNSRCKCQERAWAVWGPGKAPVPPEQNLFSEADLERAKEDS